jgi:hypothetical protein
VGPRRFSINLEDSSVAFTFHAGRDLAELDVRSPLMFATWYAVADVPLRVARNVTLGEGRLILGRGSRPGWLGVRGEEMLVSLAPNLQVAIDPPLAVACRELTLAEPPSPYASPARLKPPGARFVGFGQDTLALHGAPGTPGAWAVRYSGPFELLGARAGWIQVRAAWEDGSRLQGWTPAAPVDGAARWPSVSVEGGSTRGGCHSVDVPPLSRIEVRAGAAVAVSPAGAVWAHFSSSRWVEGTAPSSSGGWHAIARLPGITSDDCPSESTIWVHADDILQILDP